MPVEDGTPLPAASPAIPGLRAVVRILTGAALLCLVTGTVAATFAAFHPHLASSLFGY